MKDGEMVGDSMEVSVTKERPQGSKRPATDDLDSDQPLAKRFNRLSIDGNGKRLLLPISRASESGTSANHVTPTSARSTLTNNPAANQTDFMQVEDTKDRVFIHDLDEELAETESDEERPIFIPDIEKHLSKIPTSVLVGDDDRKSLANMQMVLYNVPSSLSVPESKDSVRRAIIEARERAREKQPSYLSDALRAPDSNGKRRHDVDAVVGSSKVFDVDAMDFS